MKRQKFYRVSKTEAEKNLNEEVRLKNKELAALKKAVRRDSFSIAKVQDELNQLSEKSHRIESGPLSR